MNELIFLLAPKPAFSRNCGKQMNSLISDLFVLWLSLLCTGAPSILTVKKWKGGTTLDDDPRLGRQKIATTPETFQKVYDIVLDNRQVKMSRIAEALGMLEERVRNILHE